MDTEQQNAFMVLQVKARGLEQTFLTAGGDMKLTEEDEEYARDACQEIIHALDVIRG